MGPILGYLGSFRLCSVLEYCKPGCFTELAGEFGMLPGLVADIELKGRESQEPWT